MELNSMIIVGIAAMLLMALGVVFFVILYQGRVITHQIELKDVNERKQVELAQAAIQAEEQERIRIALELHDDVNATLASARLFLFKGADSQYLDEDVVQAKTLLDESISKIRTISHKLQPATLQHLGLEESLQAIVGTIAQSGTVIAEFHKSPSGFPRLPDATELAVYRVAQEIIANMLKHSAASRISVATHFNDNVLAIEFSHDGLGITQADFEAMIYKKGAIGLKNIINRLKSISASVQYYKTDDSLYGTKILIPVQGNI
jgi:two-component system, NarL family, sensor kinase